MTALIKYKVMGDVSELPGIKTTYTCGSDGYTRAWQDLINPLLVWIEATCPVDAVVSAMAATVTSSVTTHAAESNPDNLDAHAFLQKIIREVAGDVMTYVGAHATQAVSVWIAQPSFLYPIIQAEMISQGVIEAVVWRKAAELYVETAMGLGPALLWESREAALIWGMGLHATRGLALYQYQASDVNTSGLWKLSITLTGPNGPQHADPRLLEIRPAP